MYQIDRPQLWEDELSTWSMASRGIGHLLATVQRVDAVVATYYLLLHGWIAVFGDSALALRMPSALAMAGAAGCVALSGQRLFGRRAGLAGGLVFALIPTVIRYGQEVRPYALAVFAVALAGLVLLRALDRPDSWWRWTGYALCVAAIGLLHVVALTTLLGHLVVVVVRARSDRRIVRPFCLAGLAGLACSLPVALLGMEQASRQISWIGKPDWRGLFNLWPQLFASALVTGAVITLTALAWARHTGGRRDAVWFATALAVLPPLAIWIVSHGSVSYFFYRYMLFTLPAWALLAGAGIAAVRSRMAGVAALAALALFIAPDQQAIRGPYAHFWHGVDYAGAARIIQAFYRPGDAVVYDRGNDYWYLLDVGVPYYLPRDTHLRDVFLASSAADRNDLSATECAVPAACVKTEARIWLVVAGQPADPLQALPAPQARALHSHYRVVAYRQLTGLTVALLWRIS